MINLDRRVRCSGLVFGVSSLCLGACWVPSAQSESNGLGSTSDLEVVEVALAASDLSADAAGRLYATVAEPMSPHANQLVRLDAETGAVIHALALGAEPSVAALSPDGSVLWVGLRGAPRVAKVHLDTAEPELRQGPYALSRETGPMGPAWQLAVAPGQPDRVFVSVREECDDRAFLGLDQIDTGVDPATAIVREFPSEPRAFAALAAGEDGFVFGYENVGPAFSFYVFDAAASVPGLAAYPNLLSGLADLHYAAGHIFSDGGEVIDVRDPGRVAPSRAGRFPERGLVVPARDARLAWLLTGSETASTAPAEGCEDHRPSVSGQLRLLVLSAKDFTVRQTYELAMSPARDARSFVRTGEATFAFIAEVDDATNVYIVSLPDR